jgi:hypothetical protein
MFDLNLVNRRYFSIKINNLELEIEPPKLKLLKSIMALSKTQDEDSIKNMATSVGLILSKNTKKYIVSDEIIDELDIDEMNDILTAYFEWLGKEKTSKN